MSAKKSADSLRIVERSAAVLRDIQSIPCRFLVTSILEVDVLGSGLEGARFSERVLERAYPKSLCCLLIVGCLMGAAA